jgi:dipeptidyl aminopeptidase/acylaminoacyl peptidase
VHGKRIAIVTTEIDRPTELFIGNDGESMQVSHVNDAWLNAVRPVKAIDLEVSSPDGTAIQAWLLPPFGLDESSGARYPLIVQIHGGPHAMYSHAMFHEMQAMAAKGYGVVFCNPRGSAGYGQDFTMCTRGIWGEADMPDVMAALGAALALPWVDGERVGITGGSYGGYLTNWIIGHTDRFKAAVTQRCVSNFYSFFGTSDIGFDFGTYQSDGTPWADAEKLLKHSPVSYVDKITTPLLILHSEQDLRCPIEQAEQMFAALRYLGRDVHFVRFPEEGHELSRSGTPSRRIARLRHLIGWFDTHL